MRRVAKFVSVLRSIDSTMACIMRLVVDTSVRIHLKSLFLAPGDIGNWATDSVSRGIQFPEVLPAD